MTVTNAALPFSSSVRFFDSDLKIITDGPRAIEITQQEFAHDTAVLQFWGGDVDANSVLSGQPMIITWGRPLVKRAFYGYVNHARRGNNAFSTVGSLAERNSVTVFCLGASWPMRQVASKSWTNYTATQVVTEIAALFRLAPDIVPHNTVWPSLQMTGRSYFKFCADLAKRIGYTFYVNGIQLVFKPRQTNPRNLTSLAAFYDYRNDPGSLPVFTPTVGAASPVGGELANRTLVGINPRTTQVVHSFVSGSPQPTVLGSLAASPIFSKTEHFTVDSQDEANTKLNGVSTLNQMYVHASALAIGNPLVSQGSLVFVQNANGSENGLWWIESAKHVLDEHTYSMNLELGRDSMGATASLSVKPGVLNPPAALLKSGFWSAK